MVIEEQIYSEDIEITSEYDWSKNKPVYIHPVNKKCEYLENLQSSLARNEIRQNLDSFYFGRWPILLYEDKYTDQTDSNISKIYQEEYNDKSDLLTVLFKKPNSWYLRGAHKIFNFNELRHDQIKRLEDKTQGAAIGVIFHTDYILPTVDLIYHEDKAILIEAEEVIYSIKLQIKAGNTNSKICSIIFNSFFDLYDKYQYSYSVVEKLIDIIKVDEFNNTILFGFLSAANYKRKELRNYYSLLYKMKDKIKREDNLSENELKELFYGFE